MLRDAQAVALAAMQDDDLTAAGQKLARLDGRRLLRLGRPCPGLADGNSAVARHVSFARNRAPVSKLTLEQRKTKFLFLLTCV